MKWPRVAIPLKLATPIRTRAPVKLYFLRHTYAFQFQELVMRRWDEVALVAFPVRLAIPTRTGAPVGPYIQSPPTPLKYKKWPSVAIPVRIATRIQTGAPVELYLRHPYAIVFKNELCQAGMKWPRVAFPVRLATTIWTGAPVQPYLRHPYAFEIQERVISWWDEVVQFRDPG